MGNCSRFHFEARWIRRLFVPLPYVDEAVEALLARLGLDKPGVRFVGAHIRRGDKRYERSASASMASIQTHSNQAMAALLEQVAAEHACTHVVLMSDDPHAAEAIQVILRLSAADKTRAKTQTVPVPMGTKQPPKIQRRSPTFIRTMKC